MAEESAFPHQSLILKKRTKQIPLPLCGLGMTGEAHTAEFVLFEVCGFSSELTETRRDSKNGKSSLTAHVILRAVFGRRIWFWAHLQPGTVPPGGSVVMWRREIVYLSDHRGTRGAQLLRLQR